MSDGWREVASRGAWTALQAVCGVVTVEALNVPVAWAVPVAAVLAAVKAVVLNHTATTSPAPKA